MDGYEINVCFSACVLGAFVEAKQSMVAKARY